MVISQINLFYYYYDKLLREGLFKDFNDYDGLIELSTYYNVNNTKAKDGLHILLSDGFNVDHTLEYLEKELTFLIRDFKQHHNLEYDKNKFVIDYKEVEKFKKTLEDYRIFYAI